LNKKPKFSFLLKKSAMGFLSLSPMIVGVVVLVAIIQSILTPEVMMRFFTNDPLTDTLKGALIGAVSAGNAIVSYLVGGELSDHGVSLFAVSAFLLSWVTLGIVQLPLEAKVLGIKFTVLRNILAFVFTIIIAVLTTLSVKFFS
jgi:uncharacterized membrane protein YraQ (UPF0718 family)